MIDVEYSELRKAHIEKISKENFGVDLHIKEIVASDITTGKKSYTTVFRADRQTLYALCEAENTLTLADVKEIIKSMGMEAEAYMPPYHDENYFERSGRQTFLSVFPSRKNATLQETLFYQTLSLYSPALVRIAKVNGEIRRYNSTSDKWQKDIDFSYIRMQVR